MRSVASSTTRTACGGVPGYYYVASVPSGSLLGAPPAAESSPGSIAWRHHCCCDGGLLGSPDDDPPLLPGAPDDGISLGAPSSPSGTASTTPPGPGVPLGLPRLGAPLPRPRLGAPLLRPMVDGTPLLRPSPDCLVMPPEKGWCAATPPIAESGVVDSGVLSPCAPDGVGLRPPSNDSEPTQDDITDVLIEIRSSSTTEVKVAESSPAAEQTAGRKITHKQRGLMRRRPTTQSSTGRDATRLSYAPNSETSGKSSGPIPRGYLAGPRGGGRPATAAAACCASLSSSLSSWIGTVWRAEVALPLPLSPPAPEASSLPDESELASSIVCQSPNPVPRVPIDGARGASARGRGGVGCCCCG